MKISRELQIAGMMAACAFFTLAGYEFIRSASTVLFKQAYGADSLPMVMAVMPIVVFLGLMLYSRTLSRFGPRLTLMFTTSASAVIILACYFVILTGNKPITAVLYLVKEFYIVLLIEQYWSYINSSLSRDTAKRVNGPITGIAGIGGAAGGWGLALLAEPMGTEAMVLIASLALVPAVVLGNLTYALHGEPQPSEATERSAAPQSTGHMGLRLFLSNRVLRYLLAIVFTSQIVSAVLDLKFQALLSVEYAGQTDKEAAFQGWFFGTLSTSVLVLQFIVAPALMSVLSLRLVHILMPLIHVAAIAVAIIEPSVLTVGLALFLFKAFDYSMFRAAKEVLYIPFSFDVRYRAKEVIDVFGYRAGKGVSSAAIVFLQRVGMAVSGFYLQIALACVALWLVLIFPLTSSADAAARAVEEGESGPSERERDGAAAD